MSPDRGVRALAAAELLCRTFVRHKPVLRDGYSACDRCRATMSDWEDWIARGEALAAQQRGLVMSTDLRLVVDCAAVTVEYDTVRGRDAVLIVPFPNPDPDDGRTVVLTGMSKDDILAVIDGAAGLLNLEDY